VLLVEAGPDYAAVDDLPGELRFGQAEGDVIPQSHLWELNASFGRGRAMERLARGKVVGGSSAVNGQVFLRGVPDDFSVWAEAGAAGWTFADVLPYFRRLETDHDFHDEWHGGEGPVPVRRYTREEWLPPQAAFLDACVDGGFAFSSDANNPAAHGISPLPFNNLGGVRQSAALTHLAPARARPNLTVRASTHALRIRLHGRRAEGVEVWEDGRPAFYAAHEVVLAAGVVGSPQLLMLSGIGPAAVLTTVGIEPAVDLPGVGRNLRDHHVVDLVWHGDEQAWTPGPRAPLLQFALTYSSDSTRRNDMKVTARSRSMSAASGGSAPPLLTLVPGVYQPDGTGGMTLTSADPNVPPRIEFDFAAAESDLRRLRDGVRLGLELSRNDAFAPWTAQRMSPSDADIASDDALDAWIRSSVRSSQHPCGTCRMGATTDEGTVVDPSGRVLGVDGVRIVDASVFPHTVRAHINATVLAVAERMADLIRCRR
jgi:choline dehydrogenase